MIGARATTLAALRGAIDRLETPVLSDEVLRVPFGHAEADTALKGGLMRGAMHEVFAGEVAHGAATGFVAAITRRLSPNGVVLWVRQDFAAREAGDLAMAGFAELGLDPRRIVMVRAASAESALSVAADALACNALGSVVAELWGETKAFDAVASRKLSLAAGQSGVTALMLRFSAMPQTSTAETRWVVRAARSPPGAPWEAWGAPVFDVTLQRNRHGQGGQWIMGWDCDDAIFRDTPAHSDSLAAAPVDRPHQAQRRSASGDIDTRIAS